MAAKDIVKSVIPGFVRQFLRGSGTGATRARKDSNRWLRRHCRDIEGRVLSIGSGSDSDGQGDFYRHYFQKASSYTTSEVTKQFACDIVLDVRSMPEIKDESYDCIFCSGVLEHVDDVRAGLNEITRILNRRGILLLGLPFRQALHMAPDDFWRFTEYGIRHLLSESYEVVALVPVGGRVKDFPAAYWVKARKSVRAATG